MDGSDALSHHGTDGVSAEMSLKVLACNLKLVMNVISTVGLLKAIVAKNRILLIQGAPQHGIDARMRLSRIRSPNASTVLLSLARS